MSAALRMATWLESLFLDVSADTQSSWLEVFRAQQFKKFLERGLPTRKEEWWKYTDVAYLEETKFRFPALSETATIPLGKTLDSSILMVFKNGRFSSELSNTHLLPPDVILSPLNQAILMHEDLIKKCLLEDQGDLRNPFAYLNSALARDGVFLYVPENCTLPYPIHLLFLYTEQNDFITCPRNLVFVKENAQVKIIEEHSAYQANHYFTNVMTELHVSAHARLDYYKLQKESHTATHVANIKVQQKQDSCVNTFFADYGSRLAREDLTVNMHERNAACHMKGLYLLRQDEQQIDNLIYADHVATNCTSSMLFKGILDKKSRAVFNGKVHAHAGAKQTHAEQANHNLLLSTMAEVNTKPELEIYADDVKCTHGATVGQLDEDTLFYLRARGIGKEEALQILAQAFVEEVMQTIADPDVKSYIQGQVRQHANL